MTRSLVPNHAHLVAKFKKMNPYKIDLKGIPYYMYKMDTVIEIKMKRHYASKEEENADFKRQLEEGRMKKRLLLNEQKRIALNTPEHIEMLRLKRNERQRIYDKQPERREKKKEYMKTDKVKQMKADWAKEHIKKYCECCQKEVNRKSYALHTRSQLHITNATNKT